MEGGRVVAAEPDDEGKQSDSTDLGGVQQGRQFVFDHELRGEKSGADEQDSCSSTVKCAGVLLLPARPRSDPAVVPHLDRSALTKRRQVHFDSREPIRLLHIRSAVTDEEWRCHAFCLPRIYGVDMTERGLNGRKNRRRV